MKTSILTFAFLFILTNAFSQNYKKDVALIMKDKRLNEVLVTDIANELVEILGEGFEWTEGPLWLEKENKLIFSDIPNNSIFEWTEKGGIKIYLKPAGYTGKENRGGETGSNGLLLNSKNELVLCQHGDRRIAKMKAPVTAPKAQFETIAGNYNGKKLNSPNDAVFHKNGDLYFTDPPYGLEFNMEDKSKELDFQGVYKVDKTGRVTLLTKELSRPNGIAFSPDYKKLYVANSDPEKAIWMVYDIDENGMLENGKVFFDATDKTATLKGLPDGMKVHKNGWVFACGPGGVLIFTPKGEHLGTIMTNEATANCAFNTDYSELFITADDYLLRVKLR
ncbi:MAG TPA: SMP-30/gluconolactonase/LRE family protein [Draconibacterium sp.]|nr:SMP-30/gluconolactonase/LRE family protein [Draconibacterium sp.]